MFLYAKHTAEELKDWSRPTEADSTHSSRGDQHLTFTLQLSHCGRSVLHPGHQGLEAYSHLSSKSSMFWIMTMFSYMSRDSRKGRGSNEPLCMKVWDASWCCRGDISDRLDQTWLCPVLGITTEHSHASLSNMWAVHQRPWVHLWSRDVTRTH